MKRLLVNSIFLTGALLLLVTNCEEREYINPFDPRCPKEAFTPSNFDAEQLDGFIRLSWMQPNDNISGFIIRRSENGREMIEVGRLDKTGRSWDDDDVINGIEYGYEIVAYADENLSNPQSVSITPLFPPTAVTVSANGVFSKGATLLGTVNANGLETTVSFEYGPTPTYGSTVDIIEGPVVGVIAKEISANVAGLMGNSTYHFRVVATNQGGTTHGADQTFTTTDTQSELLTTEGLVAYYPFDGNANDESGNGNDGTVFEAVLTTDRFGNSNSAYSFDGTDDYIDIGSNVKPRFPITVSLWVNTKKGAQVFRNDYHDGGSYRHGIGMSTNEGKLYSAVFEGFSASWNRRGFRSLEPIIAMETWGHFVTVFHAHNDMELYWNGSRVSAEPLGSGSGMTYSSHPGAIGKPTRGSSFYGDLDDIRVYNRALSFGEIQDLYHENDWDN